MDQRAVLHIAKYSSIILQYDILSINLLCSIMMHPNTHAESALETSACVQAQHPESCRLSSCDLAPEAFIELSGLNGLLLAWCKHGTIAQKQYNISALLMLQHV